MIGDRLQLMERRVAEDPIRRADRHPVETVIDHKVGARQCIGQIVLDVELCRGDRHIGFIDKGHLHLAIFGEQRQTQHPVATAQIDHLAGTVDGQVVQHKAGTDIETGAREDVGMVVDEHATPLQRPDSREGVGQRGTFCLRLAVNEARLLPGQRGTGRPQILLEQLEGGGMNILRLAGSDNAGCRCHHRTQCQQLLLQQCLIFGDLDHHQSRGIGQRRQRILQADTACIQSVFGQIGQGRPFTDVRVGDAAGGVRMQIGGQRAKTVIHDDDGARLLKGGLRQGVDQIFVSRIPGLQGLLTLARIAVERELAMGSVEKGLHRKSPTSA